MIQPTETPAPLHTVYAALESVPGTASPRPTVLVERVVNDPVVAHLVAALTERGFAPQATGVSHATFLEDAPGQAYQLGNGWLDLHLYPSADAAAAVATELPSKLQQSIIDWVAPLYLFRCERIIARYLGTDEQVFAALTEQCGEPFVQPPAPEPPAPPEPPLTTIDAATNSLIHSIPSMPAVSAPFVRRTVPLASGVALLYTYDAQADDQLLAVTHLSYLDWRDPVWYPDGSQYDAREAGEPMPPVQFLTGSYVVNGGPDTPETPDWVTFAGGLVQDGAVRSVAVTFSDGSQEIVFVEQGAYLAAKLDVDGVARIEARDGQGSVLHAWQGP